MKPFDQHEPHDQNGQPHTSDSPPKSRGFIRQPIMAVRADRSPLRMGSVMTETATLNTTGVKSFKSDVFRIMDDRFQQSQGIRLPLEALSPAEVHLRVAATVAANSPLATPVSSEEELKQRIAELTALTKGHPATEETPIRTACENAVDECFGQVINPIGEIEREYPLVLIKLSRTVKECCDRITYPKSSTEGLTMLTRLQHLLEYVSNDPSCLPEHKHPITARRALAAAQEAAKEQLRSISSVYVTEYFRKRVCALRNRCQSWEQRASKCAAHLQEVQSALDAELTKSQEQAAAESSQGRLVLAGISKDAVLKELRSAYDRSGAELVKHLTQLYPTKLGDRLASELEDDAGPLDAFFIASASDGMAVLEELIDGQLSSSSLYVAIEKYGVDTFVEELVAGAAPLVHLSRSNVLNNIEPSTRSILTLPQPVGTDRATLERLTNAIQEAIQTLTADSVEIRLSPAVGQSCHLTRTIMGYPSAALAENHCLASAYIESRKFNHCCHLFDVLPDSHDGQASEIVVELLSQLEQEAACHDDSYEEEPTER